MPDFPVYRISPPPLSQVAKYLEVSWEAGRLTNAGPLVRQLEERISTHLNVEPSSVVVVANATLAIQGAMETCENANGSWAVPSWTFPATYLAAHHSRKEYEIVDVDNSGRLPSKFDSQPAIEVWPFGMGATPTSFSGSAPRVIDAAASFDALESAGHLLNDSQAIVISLHATKALNGAEGGAVVTVNRQWAHRLRAWTNFGFSGTSRIPELLGTNAKMSETDAAVALASLDMWPTTRSKWSSLKRDLTQHLSRLGITTPSAIAEKWATNYLIIESGDIAADEELLESIGMETRRWWTPAHLTTTVGLSIRASSDFTNTNKFYNSWLGLPMYLSMDVDDWKFRIDQFAALRQFHDAR